MYTERDIEKKILAAAKKGKLSKLQKLLEKLKHWPIECLNESLAEAAGYGHLEIMKELIKYGADINGQIGPSMWTPLSYAVENALKDAVCFLLDKGADMNARTQKGYTPFMHSIDLLLDTYNQECLCSEQECRESACFKISQILIRAGADINAENKEGETALDTAFNYDNPVVVKILQELGAKRGRS